MKIVQSFYKAETGWVDGEDLQEAQLVFVFGDRELLKQLVHIEHLQQKYPQAEIVGCSTSGEIYGAEVRDNSISATAVLFEKTRIAVASEEISSMEESYDIGARLAKRLNSKDLHHVFALSVGLDINGSELSKGLCCSLASCISVTGGLAGDQANFAETVVVHNDIGRNNKIIAVGFYGDSINVGYGSMGGWDSFGVDREVTKSKGNILYELDGKPALELYKKYLGVHAANLPSSALLFPISINEQDSDIQLVRTVLAVDEEKGSMTFAGDIPEGSTARLMKANFDKLVDGATGAAERTMNQLQGREPELAILISCVGRKLVLKQRTEEEIESVGEIFGEQAVITGFYSYGEICPARPEDFCCELHNQTMTITAFKEI